MQAALRAPAAAFSASSHAGSSPGTCFPAARVLWLNHGYANPKSRAVWAWLEFLPASGRSSAAHEHLVEFSQGNLEPGRPAVIALPCALGQFHFPQQCIHFRNGQPAVGPNGTMARHGGQQFVPSARQHMTATKFPDLSQNVTCELYDIGILERCRCS